MVNVIGNYNKIMFNFLYVKCVCSAPRHGILSLDIAILFMGLGRYREGVGDGRKRWLCTVQQRKRFRVTHSQSVIAGERLKILRGSMNGAKVSLWSWSEAA